MSRDPGKLLVFRLADELALLVYRLTQKLPPEERYGLQSQLRRAAVSIPTNLVEGCARQSLIEYIRFVNLAASSASEVRYLLRLARRLEFFSSEDLEARYDELVRGLQQLTNSLERLRSEV